MRLQGIKIRLTIIIGSLLLLSMLLVNCVLIIFWQRDALQREIDRDQAVLAHVLDQLPKESSALTDFSPNSFSFSEFYPHGEEGQLLVFAEGAKEPVPPVVKTVFSSVLAKSVSEVMSTGEPILHYSGSFLGLMSYHSNVLVNAQPIIHQGRVVGVVAIARSLESMFQALRRAEKTVLVYILINFLILSVIGFFRMAKLVVRPIERLVQLADQYNDQETILFASDDPGGEFEKLAGSLNRMLTRIENDRESLEKTVKELEAANQKLTVHQQEMIRTEKLASIGRMAAGLAHEIGNPLGVVQGYLGLLGQSGAQSNEHQDFIRRADQELQRVNVLIRQMLDFGRVSKGDPEKFSLHSLLQSVVAMLQVQPGYTDIELVCKLDADKDILFADQDQLRQVFVNCLLNSRDAIVTRKTGEKGCISVSTIRQKDVAAEEKCSNIIRITIKDNGSGVPDGMLDKVFDPFVTSKEPGQGTGLGLSVSLAIVEGLNGRMVIINNETAGADVLIDLPVTGE